MSGKKPLSTQERAKGTAYAQILYILGDRTRTFSELMNCLALFIKNVCRGIPRNVGVHILATL